MPYEMFRQGEKFCVRNKQTGESKGCSDSRKMAVEHMRALYAAEGGAKMGKKEIDDLLGKSIADYLATNPDEAPELFYKEVGLAEMHEKGYAPWGVTSFADLDKFRQAEELSDKTFSLTDDFYSMIRNIMYTPEIEDKAAAVKTLADEFSLRIKSLDGGDEEKSLPEAELSEDDFIEVVDDMSEYEADVVTLDDLFEYDGNHVGEGKDTEKAKRQDVSEADKKRAVAEYGDVKYADPANKKYPIDNEKHIRAAWSYINMPKNAAKYPDKGASIRRKVIAAWKKIIDPKGPPQAKKEKDDEGPFGPLTEAFNRLTDQLKSIFKKDAKDEPPEEESAGSFMTYKDQSGKLHWLVSYSNNFRDDDNPREIISEKSHRRFVDLVDKGQAETPELWVWHQPEWKFGHATWVAYDDSGFSMAAGDVDKGQEEFAEYLSKCKGVRLSHGMPITSLRRDPENQTVILEHTTKEISVLPDFAAANKYTGFVLLKARDNQLEEDMAIPKKKIDALVSSWGEGVKGHLDAMMKQNGEAAEQAAKEGRDTKEKTEGNAGETVTVTDTTAAETVVTTTTDATIVSSNTANPVDTTEPAEETSDKYTVEDIAEAFANTVKPYAESVEEVKANQLKLAEALDALTKEIATMKQDKDVVVKEVVSNTPAASVAAMIARHFVASTSPDTAVDGRSALAKDKPAEVTVQKTGIEFIDQMLSAK